jgi:hypothetical protein
MLDGLLNGDQDKEQEKPDLSSGQGGVSSPSIHEDRHLNRDPDLMYIGRSFRTTQA